MRDQRRFLRPLRSGLLLLVILLLAGLVLVSLSIGWDRICANSRWYFLMDPLYRPRWICTMQGRSIAPEEMGVTSKEINEYFAAAGLPEASRENDLGAMRKAYLDACAEFIEKNKDKFWAYFQKNGDLPTGISDASDGTGMLRLLALCLVCSLGALCLVVLKLRNPTTGEDGAGKTGERASGSVHAS